MGHEANEDHFLERLMGEATKERERQEAAERESVAELRRRLVYMGAPAVYRLLVVEEGRTRKHRTPRPSGANAAHSHAMGMRSGFVHALALALGLNSAHSVYEALEDMTADMGYVAARAEAIRERRPVPAPLL